MRRLSWSWFAVVLLVMLVSCTGGEQAERFSPIDPASSIEFDSYIVVLHGAPGAARAEANRAAAADVARAYGLVAEHTYGAAIVGFAARVPAGRLVALQRDPRVAYVERDAEVTIFAQEVPTGVRRIFADTNADIDIDGIDDYRVDVDVAVIDTGIDFQHPDLNVVGGVNCTSFWPFGTATCVAGGDDDHYHGTHVAGTIGALDNGEGVVGVAPGARLWAVKVLNKRGSGYTSWIVGGIDWVAANANTIEVANMSLGGAGFSQAEYDAIQGAVNAGVAFAVAAGNEDDDANNYSPGGFDNVLSVSALADFDGVPGGLGAPTCRTDQDDTLADFSNWGPEVDIAAPGVCITSTYPLEQGGYGTISGTSMASPHVAGALALLASASNPGNASDVYDLYNQVKNAGNDNWTDDSSDGILEPLLDVRTFAPSLTPVGGGNTAPTVTVTSPADGASFDSGTPIVFTGTASDAEDGNLTSSLSWTSSLVGSIGTGGSFSTSTLQVGTHTITASVTDSGGLSASDGITITVTTSTPNSAPTASFDYTCTGLTCSFTDTSTDADGTVVARSWSFGDGATSDAAKPSHTYETDGTYEVTLTVTDDDLASDSTSQDVTVSAPVVNIDLSVTGRNVRGRNYADLEWSGATSSKVDVYRNSSMLTTTKNDGAYTDAIGTTGGTYTYKVCEAGSTTTCSNEATVIF